VESVREVLLGLAQRYAFAEIAALVAEGAGSTWLTIRQGGRVQQLCAFGQRLLDFDAEDFGVANAAKDANTDATFAGRSPEDVVPAALVDRALACRVPQSAQEPDRGALGSLRPPFALMLEVMAAHWLRRETAALVAAAHLASEYLPLLVWQQVLGHAGDPLRLPPQVTGGDSAWGDQEDRDCPHSGADKAAAARVLVVAHENARGWTDYLDRQHSLVSRALCVCAGRCHRPCSVFTRYSTEQRALLEKASRTASAYAECDLVKLRHHAPVGHGFGVPSPREVTDAWARSRAWLGKREPATLIDDGFPLPGLPSLFGALAGVPIQPDTLIADTSQALVDALR
jgi:hypothetical protein